MPCRSEYMEPTSDERARERLAIKAELDRLTAENDWLRELTLRLVNGESVTKQELERVRREQTKHGVTIQVKGKIYQKFRTTEGFLYLEEVTRAQEEVHEESTTVRDFTGSVVAEYLLCECTECGSSNVSNAVRDSGVPAGLDAAFRDS